MSELQSTKHNAVLKTAGRQTARLLTALYDRAQSTFTLADAEKITGLSSNLASSLLHKAVGRGLVSRVTQPQLVVFASSLKRIRSRKLHGTEFRFVLIRPEQYFGVVKHWVTKQETIDISDLERTIIDGLRQPEYCGGVTEVAKGLWMRHQDMRTAKLVDYALRVRVGAVSRRLGYLLDLYGMVPESELARLRASLTATYAALDPMLPEEGPHLKRWRLQLNISPRELEAVRAT